MEIASLRAGREVCRIRGFGRASGTSLWGLARGSGLSPPPAHLVAVVESLGNSVLASDWLKPFSPLKGGGVKRCIIGFCIRSSAKFASIFGIFFVKKIKQILEHANTTTVLSAIMS